MRVIVNVVPGQKMPEDVKEKETVSVWEGDPENDLLVGLFDG